MRHGLNKQEQSLQIVTTMDEHSDMQANKLNAKYHLHVQHLTDAKH